MQPPYIYFSTFIQDRLFSIFILLDYVQERVGFDGSFAHAKRGDGSLVPCNPSRPRFCVMVEVEENGNVDEEWVAEV
jgi:hypothetical protein